MALERTFSIVKPDGVARNLIGEVYRRFEQAGFGVLPKRGSLDAMLDRLAHGDAIVFAFDQHASPPDGIAVDFFGQPAWTFKRLAIIALATGAPVVPATSWREPDGRHVLRFEAPIAPVEHASTNEAINPADDSLLIDRNRHDAAGLLRVTGNVIANPKCRKISKPGRRLVVRHVTIDRGQQSDEGQRTRRGEDRPGPAHEGVQPAEPRELGGGGRHAAGGARHPAADAASPAKRLGGFAAEHRGCE
mgnify:CR=1 FL=1